MDITKRVVGIFLLCRLQNLIEGIFKASAWNDLSNKVNLAMECYDMDQKIIQFIIRSIVESGEYTLEGISYHTRIPFDVILDVMCGNKSAHISVTLWARMMDLFMQVRPEVSQILLDRLVDLKNDHAGAVSSLLWAV